MPATFETEGRTRDEVQVVGVRIPFGEMIILLTKVFLAALPAILLAAVIGAFVVQFLIALAGSGSSSGGP